MTEAQAVTPLVERLHAHVASDHIRGCMGRQYSCDCGYDLKTEGLLEMAAAEIERLRAALKPLAEWAIDVTAKPTLADCDRARRALEPKP